MISRKSKHWGLGQGSEHASGVQEPTTTMPFFKSQLLHLTKCLLLRLQQCATESLFVREPCREAAAGHTGQFSWRAGPSGTALAQHGSAPSTTGGPARGPWANTGMVRARLAGLSFGGPAQLGQSQVCTLASATQFHRLTVSCKQGL